MSGLQIRRTGARSHPWCVTCSDCPARAERLHFAPSIGVVIVNDQGVGNRTFPIAIAAATEHLRDHANLRDWEREFRITMNGAT